MSCVLHDWHERDSKRTSLAKSLYIPRHEHVHIQCCNTEVPDNSFSPKTRFMFYSTAWAPGTSQLMSDHSRPDDCAHFEASPHTNTRNCLLVSSPAKSSRQQSAHTISQFGCASPSKQLAPHSVKSQPAIVTAQPINAVAGSINALEQEDCSDVWRQNKSRQDLQRLRKTHVDSEWKHAQHVAPRSIESALSISTAAFRIRARRTHVKQPHRRFCNVEVAVLMTRCGGTLQRSGASGERHVCNSALNEYNSILEPCHINLRTTREHFSAPPNDFPQCTRDKMCQPKQAIDPHPPTPPHTLSKANLRSLPPS